MRSNNYLLLTSPFLILLTILAHYANGKKRDELDVLISSVVDGKRLQRKKQSAREN